MSKNIKKILLLVISFLLLCFINNSINVNSKELLEFDFNNITENECAKFVQTYNISVPTKLQNQVSLEMSQR